MPAAVRAYRPTGTLFWVAAALLVLNLLDGVMTLAWIHLGLAVEANPLMASSMSLGSLWFMASKLALVSLGVLLLWRRRRSALASGALVGLTALYAGIFAYHVHSLSTIARHLS